MTTTHRYRPLIVIAALTHNRVIGRDGAMPWHIPEELRHFKRLTMGHTLIVGRKTFEAVGPLPGRKTVVLSRSLVHAKGAVVCRSLPEAIGRARSFGKKVFVAGGAAVYRQALPLADALFLSYIKGDYEGDVRFPDFEGDHWELVRTVEHTDFTFVVYRRRPLAGHRPLP